jgi:glycerophosphoryl diester phosphodiesterase
MRFKYEFFIFIILFSCSKNKKTDVLIFGHAGMGLSVENSLFHDNSKESIELCLLLPNSDGVEVDVQLDNQGELWLYHDEYLDNISSLDGCVNDKTTVELEQAYYRTLKKEKLVKLSHILPLIGTTQKLFLDLKIRNACSKKMLNVNQFKESLSNLDVNETNNVVLILSDTSWIKKMEDIFPVYFGTDNFNDGYHFLINNPNTLGIVIRNKAITSSEIEMILAMNKEIYLYDIRSPKGNREAINKNPNGIITDDIRAALMYKK